MSTAPYGSWKSPITADVLVSSNIGLAAPVAVGDVVYWQEGRPTESGRNVIVRRLPDGRTEDVNPQPFNARTRVTSTAAPTTLSTATRSTSPTSRTSASTSFARAPSRALTHAEGHRYADFVIDRARNRLICVREAHAGDSEPVNDIAAIDLATGEETALPGRHDFFAYPRLSPDGAHLAWMVWDPRDALGRHDALRRRRAPDGSLSNPQQLAGGPVESDRAAGVVAGGQAALRLGPSGY